MLMWLLVEVKFFLMVKAKGVQVMYGQELGGCLPGKKWVNATLVSIMRPGMRRVGAKLNRMRAGREPDDTRMRIPLRRDRHLVLCS
jgi:hypothetical protein